MNGEITTKRSPIVLVWKFAIIEIAAGFLYFGATLLGNTKYEFYLQLPLSDLLSYQAAKILFLAGAQFAVTVYAFLSWYYDEYVIRPGSVTHLYGVFKRKEHTISISSSASVKISSNPLGKFLHYGSIHIKNNRSSLVLAHISRPERLMKVIKQENVFDREPDISQLLKEVEHDRLEFKSSLRFDYKANQANRDIEKGAMKAVAALLNSKGGYLVVGVGDSRAPLGLENDYQTLQRKDRDGFENHFTQSFNNMIGPEFRNLVKLWFRDVEGRDLCTIQVLPSPRPVYLKADNSEHFYMRTGNISTSLKLSEIEAYCRSHWPGWISEA
ncbi:ATP-binding protein [Candidatus Parcubacteria bacterium]|nr:MAG: ATP-binding protein [Candidatus Parcubacteria bacterium]